MPPVAVGDKLPNGSQKWFNEEDHTLNITIQTLAAGKKIVLFGVNGAFFPTCSVLHVPGFIALAEEFKSKGVDEILCISANDPFVMREWAKTYPENQHVKFMADGSGMYIRALGLEIDLSKKGLGVRSRRFALLADDLVVKVVCIEEVGAFTISGANEILKAL